MLLLRLLSKSNKMKNKIVVLLLIIFLSPTIVSAGGASGSWGCSGGPTNGILKGICGNCYENGDCTFCDVVKVGTNIFNFLRNSIAFPIAVLFILYGGVLMIFAGGSKSQIENGKKILFAALIGFAIVLAVSLILNSVLIVLSGEKGGWKAFVNGSIGCGMEQNLNTP